MKLQLALVAALFCAAPIMAQGQKPVPGQGHQALVEAYSELREKYLPQLPKDVDIKVAEHLQINGHAALGYTECLDFLPNGRRDGCTIYLGVAENGGGLNTMVFTLYHESCHIVTYGFGHGPEWQKCMLNLAEEGAFADVW